MRTFLRAALISAVATAGFAAVVSALAPDSLRRRGEAADDRSLARAIDGEIDADDLTDAQALALLRELAHDLDTSDLDKGD